MKSRTLTLLLGGVAWLTLCSTACTTPGGAKVAAPSPVETDLKVSAGSGRLKAKITFKNNGGEEAAIGKVDSRYFVVQTVDGKPVQPKDPAGKGEEKGPLSLKPGQSVEVTFSLQDAYPFWDRLTKYRIWYDGGGHKSNVAQVWF